jgi:DNA-binding transcriptional regulator GbsR (MarR family)
MNDFQLQSMFIEDEEDHKFSKLMEAHKRLMKENQRAMKENKVKNKEVEAMKKTLNQLLRKSHYTHLFLEDGHEVAVRAFLDKVLEMLYEVAEVVGPLKKILDG